MLLSLETSDSFQWQLLVLRVPTEGAATSHVESTENLKHGHKAQGAANGQVHPGCAARGCWLLPWLAASK